MPSPKLRETQELDRLPRPELIRRIVAMEDRLEKLRQALAAERRYANRMHDRAVRLACADGLRITDGDVFLERI